MRLFIILLFVSGFVTCKDISFDEPDSCSGCGHVLKYRESLDSLPPSIVPRDSQPQVNVEYSSNSVE